MTLDKALRDRASKFVPPDLLARLPEVEAVTEAIRRLSGLHKTIGSFIPQYVADDESLQTQSTGLLRPGAFLFADVSGFTALSEHLRERGGDAGAETLTLVINDYFSTMLEILAKSDGQLLKFAGDALLAFFPAPSHESVPKAIRTGLRMQRAMSKFQPIQLPELARLLGEHSQSLTMSIGISYGELFEAYVGNNAQRDHLIQGRLPGNAMNAEGAGERDDVIIGAELEEIACREFRLNPLADGFFRVIDDLGDRLDDYEFQIPQRRRAKTAAIFDFEIDNLVETLRDQLDRVENVSRFVAPAVLAELVSNGGDHLQSQNRLVVTMFVHVSGFAEALETWGADHLSALTPILERYYSMIQRTVSVHGGSVTRSDPYQLGMKLLITFGAPIANPDDPQRAVATALEMQRQVEQLNQRLYEELPAERREGLRIVQRIGITLGPVFAGEVGWRARREYTVMGDDVNLAARLMSKAEMGQTLISERVWQRVRHAFEAEPVEPLRLKGKRLPAQAYAVTAATRRSLGMAAMSDTPFTGRDWELQKLQSLLREARSGVPVRAARLMGEVGVGKSRIARQMTFLAETAGFQVAWSTCALRSEDNTTWSMLLAQLLDIQPHDEAKGRRTLRKALADLNLEHLTPALADILFAGSDPNPSRSSRGPVAPPALRNIYSLAAHDEAPVGSPGGLFKLASEHLSDSAGESQREKASLWQKAGARTNTGEAIVEFLKAYSRRCPTMLVIDDLQRENKAALQVLRRVLSETEPMQLVVLLAHEPEEIDLDLEPMPVDELPEPDAELMTLRYLDVERLSGTLHATLWRQARGHPLYLEILLQALIEKNMIYVHDGCADLRDGDSESVLPDDVRKLIMSRVDRLHGPAQATLRAACVLGESFDREALEAVAGIARHQELDTALNELIEKGLIDANSGETFVVRHGITQRVVYESLPRRLRQRLRQAADLYDARQADNTARS